MAKNRNYTVAYKRKRNGITNYRKRMKYLKSEKPRLVIRPSINSIVLQIVTFNPEGDKVICVAKSQELKQFGWKYSYGNIPSAYLTGLLIGRKTEIKEAVADFGMYTPIKGSRIYAALKGAKDAGLAIPVSEDVLPSEEAVSGKTIENYAKKLAGDKGKKQFSTVDPLHIVSSFDTVKKNILKVDHAK